MNEIVLTGCAPDPLLFYLKALGIFRIVAHQGDSDARFCWSGPFPVLCTRLSDAELQRFFLETWIPTPILAPWNGGSGFYPKDNRVAIDAIRGSTQARFAPYREAIAVAQRIVSGRSEAPKEDEKTELLRRCRRELPEDVLTWLDAALVLGTEKPSYFPLLGTGGNDGRLDFTNNFMARLGELLLQDVPAEAGGAEQLILGPVRSKSKKKDEGGDPATRLRAALFGGSVRLESVAIGQYHPGGAGGVNSSEGPDGDSLVNPWDFVLALEGALFFASATVRKLAPGSRNAASFPFTAEAARVGYGTAVQGEKARAEMWLPLWSRPVGMAELTYLMGEGRARFASNGRRAVTNGFDFARAASSLGVDRGIDAFQRFTFVERNGQAYLATSVGRFEAGQRERASLINDLDQFMSRVGSATRDANRVPPRFMRARVDLEEACFNLLSVDSRDQVLAVLNAAATLERELARGKKFRDENAYITPIPTLTSSWTREIEGSWQKEGDRRPEFFLARALASIQAPPGPIQSPMRSHLEPVVPVRNAFWVWEESNDVVWSIRSLDENLRAVLQRRLLNMQSGKERQAGIYAPLYATRTARLKDIDHFLNRRVEDSSIDALLGSLSLLSWREPEPPELEAELPPTLSRAYAIFKLLFVPFGKVSQQDDATGEIHYTQVKCEPAILPLLVSGRAKEALLLANRRLRSCGLVPLSDDFAVSPNEGPRLASALVFPVSEVSVRALTRAVLRPFAKRL